jgi:hypothetical protein
MGIGGIALLKSGVVLVSLGAVLPGPDAQENWTVLALSPSLDQVLWSSQLFGEISNFLVNRQGSNAVGLDMNAGTVYWFGLGTRARAVGRFPPSTSAGAINNGADLWLLGADQDEVISIESGKVVGGSEMRWSCPCSISG